MDKTVEKWFVGQGQTLEVRRSSPGGYKYSSSACGMNAPRSPRGVYSKKLPLASSPSPCLAALSGPQLRLG